MVAVASTININTAVLALVIKKGLRVSSTESVHSDISRLFTDFFLIVSYTSYVTVIYA
jgi:hypothetical protein